MVAAEEQSPAAPNLNVRVGAVGARWPFFSSHMLRKQAFNISVSSLHKNTSCSKLSSSSVFLFKFQHPWNQSTKPLPRTKNCSFNKNHSQRMPDSCGFSMVAEVPLFLSNVNSKYRIVPSFAVACAEPSWSKVGTSIWLKTWSFATVLIKVAKGKLQHVALWLG